MTAAKVSLDQLFLSAKLCLGDPVKLEPVMRAIFRQHGGLSASYQKRHGKHLEPYEMMGYAWEALPTAIAEYDPKRGKATTVWGLVIRRITVHQRDTNIYVGAVKVGIKVKKRFKGTGFEEAVTGSVDRSYLMLLDDSAMIFGDCPSDSISEGE